MILVLAGTADGRQTAQLLAATGCRLMVAVVSDYAARLLPQDAANMEVLSGALDSRGLSTLLDEKKITVIVDATHPYAVQISRLAMELAAASGLKYIRLERKGCPLPPSPLINTARDINAIGGFLSPGQNVFSTLGSKSIPRLVPLVKKAGANLTVRVLPVIASLRVCKEAGIRPGHIVALQGPFPKHLNKSLFKHYQTDLVLTKESGDIGGFNEKIGAALELDIPVLVLTRPVLNYPLLVNSPPEAAAWAVKNY